MFFQITEHWFDLGIIRILIIATFDDLIVVTLYGTENRRMSEVLLCFPVNAGSSDPSKAKLSNFKFTTGEQLRYALV